MATIHRMYTFYSTNCRMYTFYNSPIKCIHSTSLAIECIHSMTFYILYSIYILQAFFIHSPHYCQVHHTLLPFLKVFSHYCYSLLYSPLFTHFHQLSITCFIQSSFQSVQYLSSEMWIMLSLGVLFPKKMSYMF